MQRCKKETLKATAPSQQPHKHCTSFETSCRCGKSKCPVVSCCVVLCRVLLIYIKQAPILVSNEKHKLTQNIQCYILLIHPNFIHCFASVISKIRFLCSTKSQCTLNNSKTGIYHRNPWCRIHTSVCTAISFLPCDNRSWFSIENAREMNRLGFNYSNIVTRKRVKNRGNWKRKKYIYKLDKFFIVSNFKSYSISL